MKFDMRQLFLAATLLFVGAIPIDPALAGQCRLKQVASFDVGQSSDGAPLVPVKIGDTLEYFELDPSAAISAITAKAADELGLRRTSVPQNLIWFIGGERMKEKVTTSLKIGDAEVHAYLGLSYGPISDDPRVAGILAFDLLHMMDLELDLAHHKVNLFSQDHCKGRVVYWTRTAAVAAIPLNVRGNGQEPFKFNMKLDGKTLETQLRLTSAHGQLNSIVAERKFGIRDNDPEDAGASHVFKTLDADGITILNPSIQIYQASWVCAGREIIIGNGAPVHSATAHRRCYGAAPLYLGTSEVSSLRMYFAFGERMLYATAANAN